MSLRCPHCSSIIDALDAASSSIICPGCGEELSGTSIIGRREETRHDVQVHPEGTITYRAEVPVSTGKPDGIPNSLGRYRLLDELGAGAFGRVYRGYDAELQRSVAIKILKKERFANQDELNRFFDEARLMASVHHPGIVAVHDVGIDGGVYYIVTQLISGGTLHDRLVREPISHTAAADLLRQCAGAIHAAHKIQLYHRDLKPKNILLDEQGRAYVGDFGLAIRRRDQIDRIGEFAGSVNFMSPEQLRGDVHCIDGRTDVWALGVIFYLMLTGKLPFQGSTSRLLTEIQTRNPVPPRQLDESIPRELERICLKCLNKPIEERYPTAFDLAEDLGHVLTQAAARQRLPFVDTPGLPGSTSEDPQASTILERPPAKPRSPRKIFIAAGLVVLAGLGWFARNALTIPGSPKRNGITPAEAAAQPLSPFQIDSFATVGRPYGLLEVAPPPVLWPREQTLHSARFDYVEPRQELLVEAPEECLVGLGQTESESFRIRLSIKRLERDGFAGIFWGYQEQPPELAATEHHCHAVLVQGISEGRGKSRLEMHRSRMIFRDEPQSSQARFEHSMLSSVIVTVKDAGPHDLDIVIHKGSLTSVKWCGDELRQLHDAGIVTSKAPLPARGVFGVVTMNSSARFSDARVTFVDKASQTKPLLKDAQ